MAGEYLVQVTGGKARVGLLEGIPGHETGDSRLKGFHDAVKGAPGITVVASQTANWERDQGFTVFQNMLQAHPEIDALFAVQRPDGARRGRGDRGRGQDGQDPRHRLRRGGRRAQGDRRGDDARRRSRSSRRRWDGSRWKTRSSSSRGEKPEPEQKVRIELVTKATLDGEVEMSLRRRSSASDSSASAGSGASTRATSPRASPRRGSWPSPTPIPPRAPGSRRSTRSAAVFAETRGAAGGDPAIDAFVIVRPTHTHREPRGGGGGARASRPSARSRRR